MIRLRVNVKFVFVCASLFTLPPTLKETVCLLSIVVVSYKLFKICAILPLLIRSYIADL